MAGVIFYVASFIFPIIIVRHHICYEKIQLPITGHLDITVAEYEDEFEGKVHHWNEIMIHGNPDGLRSLANLLLQLADLDQEKATHFPIGAREHFHLKPKFDLSKSSEKVIVGRLDAKGTGAFYDNYVPK